MLNFFFNIKLLKFFTLIIFQILILNISNIYSQNASLIDYLNSQNTCPINSIYNGTNKIKTFHSSAFKPKIVGGFPAKLKRHEHLVSIRYKAKENDQFGSGHFCGGSLIAPNLVLTAAHCLVDKILLPLPADSIVVVMGALRLNDQTNSHTREVSRVTVHKNYNNNFHNDIGLLHLKEPFELSSSIKVIPYAHKANYSVGQSVELAGWGATIEEGDASPLMMTTSVKIVSRDECKRAYYGFNVIIDTMFCAADGNKDSCQGDSGGPLVSKRIQYGIVSWGNGCGKPGYPGVYTDVSSYVDWIKKNSGNKIIIHSATYHFLSLIVA